MAALAGYDGKYGLKGWPADDDGPPRECSSDDLAALKARAGRLIAEGVFACVELSAWNFELNDWVRLETFGARPPRAEA